LTKSVFVRSALVPVANLIGPETTTTTTDCKLYVAFETTTSVSCLVVESKYPVLILDSKDKNERFSEQATIQIAKFCQLSGNSNVNAAVDRVVMSRRQAVLVDDATCRTQSPAYRSAISTCYDTNLQITGDNVIVQGQSGQRGKVRDRFERTTDNNNNKNNNSSNNNNVIALVTTDRQSGFDRQLALVPFKGAVLNMCSFFWFEQTSDIIGNHLIATPHPYVSIAKKCKPFPIEFVVRYVKKLIN
jgi:SAICAR synthetase